MGKNMNRKSWNKKSVVAGMTALAVLAAGAVMSEVNVYAAENMQPKEEVVYVMTGADGTVESVNVVNIFGKGDVTDYGDYSTVKMLNATDAISLENGVVTFSTQKEKVYYQGTLENAQIPWKISVKYSLDGKEISPDELAGSTGQLDIALKVEKNDACRGEFYEDYALQVNMTLSTQNCENISAEGATVANVGADKQISCTVLPGKGLEAQTASLSNIVTLLGGNNAAILGTAQYFEAVYGGASELVNGLAQLDSSYEQFDAAIANLVNSISGIANNVSALKAGVDQLTGNYSSLNGGINSYTGGVGSIVSAYSQIVTATEALVEGSGKLTEGSASLRQGTADLYDGIVSLDDGAKELNDGTKEFYEKTDGMDSEIEGKIDDMLNTISRSDAEIRSFVSKKNSNVESVQFVIKTGAVEKPEAVQTVEDEPQQLSLWEKFLRLFGR